MASAVSLYRLPYIPLLLGFWLVPAFLLIFVIAAFLHWQRTRHWCLLAMAAGPLLMALGTIAARIGEMPIYGHTMEEIASGSVRPVQVLMTIATWASFCGFALAAVGALGAIHWAIKLRRTKADAQ
jgi:hypothetical protein